MAQSVTEWSHKDDVPLQSLVGFAAWTGLKEIVTCLMTRIIVCMTVFAEVGCAGLKDIHVTQHTPASGLLHANIMLVRVHDCESAQLFLIVRVHDCESADGTNKNIQAP